MKKLPKISQKSPLQVELEAGVQYAMCSCGLSAKEPFCDGTHRGTGFKSFKYLSEESKTAYLCSCKHSKNFPFCDGTHSKLDEITNSLRISYEEIINKDTGIEFTMIGNEYSITCIVTDEVLKFDFDNQLTQMECFLKNVAIIEHIAKEKYLLGEVEKIETDKLNDDGTKVSFLCVVIKPGDRKRFENV